MSFQLMARTRSMTFPVSGSHHLDTLFLTYFGIGNHLSTQDDGHSVLRTITFSVRVLEQRIAWHTRTCKSLTIQTSWRNFAASVINDNGLRAEKVKDQHGDTQMGSSGNLHGFHVCGFRIRVGNRLQCLPRTRTRCSLHSGQGMILLMSY